jgi:hypothetical protein
MVTTVPVYTCLRQSVQPENTPGFERGDLTTVLTLRPVVVSLKGDERGAVAGCLAQKETLRRGVLSDETNVPVRRGVSEVTHDVPSVEVDLIL